MTNKEIVQDILQRIPDDASFEDIVEAIKFTAAIERGLFELDKGKSIPIEQIEKDLASWCIK